jgi:hypothetical protein
MTEKPLFDKKFVGNKQEIGKSKDKSQGILVDGEAVILEYKGIRDAVAFTDKRIVLLDPQGMTGKKINLVSIPYKAISAFSIETAGTLDLDSELKITGSGLGILEFSFARGTDLFEIARILNTKTLS